MSHNDDDPRGLIREAYRIAGITMPECRSIFLDWALSLPDGADLATSAARLLAAHAPADHPMTQILNEAQADAPPRARRGGRKARHPQ